MIEYKNSKSPFNDSPLRPYELSKRLILNHLEDECEIFIVYGTPEGIGKSAYVSHVLADIYGYFNCHDEDLVKTFFLKREEALKSPKWNCDWEAVRPRTFYPPEEVVDKCMWMLDNDKVDIAFHWDDAGKWLYAMEWSDPFVIAFMEYLPLARANWKGGIFLSTPFKDWILRRLVESEGILQIRIVKPQETNFRYTWKPRIAHCHKKERYLGNPRTYYPRQFSDHFIAIMHQPFYDWYAPRRRAYGKLATVKMKLAIEKRKRRGWSTEEAEQILEMEKHIFDANDKSKEWLEATRSYEKPA